MRKDCGSESLAASGLAGISGVGPTRLDRYAEPVLALIGGADPEEVELVTVS